MSQLELESKTSDYSFQEYQARAGLLIGPYLLRYKGREGFDLSFGLSSFDTSKRYIDQEAIVIKSPLSQSLRLFQDGTEYVITPKDICSEVDLEVHRTRTKRVNGEYLEDVMTLKDYLIPRSSETPPSLDQSISYLSGKPDLESSFLPTPSWFAPVLDLATKTTHLAFEAQDQNSLLIAHRSLKALYDLHLSPNIRAANQNNPFLGFVRNIIEDGWMNFEEQRVTVDPKDVPKDKKGFSQYFQDMVMSHPAASSRLYDFLKDKASKEQVIKFLLTEQSLDVRFFDIVVLSALGTEGIVRKEISENLWDESGAGVEQQAHTKLFGNLLESMGIKYKEDELVKKLDWQSLAGYNLFLNLGLNRKNYYRFVGCLGATELLDPQNYTKFMSGCRRLGLDKTGDFTYYNEHIDIDVKHGSGWIDNVMLPLLDSHENAGYQFLLGAQMRLNTGHDYYEALYTKLAET